MEASENVAREGASTKETEVEMVRAAAVVTAIRLDIYQAKGRWPDDTRMIRGIKLVLFQAHHAASLDELLSDQETLLSKMIVEYLDAIRPRLHVLPPEVSAEEILGLAMRIQPQFVAAEEAIRQDPSRFIREPESLEEWIERSAYSHLQLQERLKERSALTRAEFEVLEEENN